MGLKNRLIAIFLMTFVQAGLEVGAAFGLPVPRPVTVDGLFPGASSVEVADLDSDGRKDIIGASYYADSVMWWRNLGNDQWSSQPIHSLYGAYALASGDIDGDSDIDIVALSRPDNSVWWYENVPAGFGRAFVTHFVMRRPGEIGHAVTVGDFDNDSTTDIGVAYRMDPYVYVARNIGGSGAALSANIVSLPVVGNGVSLVLGEDVDGDGDDDLIGATPWDWVGSLNYFWFRNDGGGQFSNQIKIGGGLPLNGAFGARFGDLDGDGLKDLVILSEQNPAGLTQPLTPIYPAIQWIRRVDPRGLRWEKPQPIDSAGFGSDGPTGIDVVDIDRDGDLDVVSGSALINSKSAVWINHYNGRRWRRFDVELGFGLHGVRAADLSGDGLPEIVGASWGGCCYTGEIRYWRFY